MVKLVTTAGRTLQPWTKFEWRRLILRRHEAKKNQDPLQQWIFKEIQYLPRRTGPTESVGTRSLLTSILCMRYSRYVYENLSALYTAYTPLIRSEGANITINNEQQLWTGLIRGHNGVTRMFLRLSHIIF